MKYLKEITEALKDIEYQYYAGKKDGNFYMDDDDIERNVSYYPIGFYALHIKSLNKMVIFNHKIFKDCEHEPKFLWEFDIKLNKETPRDTLLDILTQEAIKQDEIYPNNKYDYSRIEFCVDRKEDEYLIDDIYFINIVQNKVEGTRIEQFLTME
jgi:hypothetical protein